MRESVQVELVCDEKREDDDSRGIRPELVSKEACYEDYFDDAVAEEIQRSKPAGLSKE